MPSANPEDGPHGVPGEVRGVASLEDADVIALAVKQLIAQDVASARRTLASLPIHDSFDLPRPREFVPMQRVANSAKSGLSDHVRFVVYERDGWRCCYCHRKVVVPLVALYLTILVPGFKGALPGWHLKKTLTEPAIIRTYPHVDHKHPRKLGGSNDFANLVTACDRCNTAKSDRVGWAALPVQKDEWRGLFDEIRPLAELVQEPTRRSWLTIAKGAVRADV